jgi:hypothetical protein
VTALPPAGAAGAAGWLDPAGACGFAVCLRRGRGGGGRRRYRGACIPPAAVSLVQEAGTGLPGAQSWPATAAVSAAPVAGAGEPAADPMATAPAVTTAAPPIAYQSRNLRP